MERSFDIPLNSPTIEEGAEVVVTAKIDRLVSPLASGGMFHVSSFVYGTHYGEGTNNPEPYGEEPPVSDETTATEIVVTGIKTIAIAIRTVTAWSAPLLIAREETRLRVLADGMDKAADALAVGEIDLATAQTMVTTALQVALDHLGGIGTGALFSAIGSAASVAVPSPQLKALMIAGLGAIGLAVDEAISQTGMSETIAKALSQAIFGGSKAVADLLVEMHDTITAGRDVIFGETYDYNHQMSFEVQSDGQLGNFDDNMTNGSELNIGLYHDGLGSAYKITTNRTVPWPGRPGSYDPPMPEESRLIEGQMNLGDDQIYNNYQGYALRSMDNFHIP